ncbi:unnamed protein product [Enterobius vermicularis]|uniref:Collagen alpha-1(I) chain-like n=1 Tax=Enterobius vermicularis TaxID=51028 RepID=A0A0N4UWN4_ENTVE|nr:unnamed protein product [Enterobius vermicularis]
MGDNRGYGDKRHRGNRGGVKKRMAMGGVVGLGVLGGPGPMRSFPRPQFLSSANSVPVPYGLPARPGYGPIQANPSGKYGFFEGPQGFGPPGYEVCEIYGFIVVLS